MGDDGIDYGNDYEDIEFEEDYVGDDGVCVGYDDYVGDDEEVLIN